MITINNLSKNFNQRVLLKDVSLSIYRNEKIGLTGPNGAGKTTLFSMILGQMEPTGGNVQVQKNLNIGFLPQETHFESTQTVIEELTSGDNRIRALKKEKHGKINAVLNAAQQEKFNKMKQHKGPRGWFKKRAN